MSEEECRRGNQTEGSQPPREGGRPMSCLEAVARLIVAHMPRCAPALLGHPTYLVVHRIRGKLESVMATSEIAD
jgi:hypothetical protein